MWVHINSNISYSPRHLILHICLHITLMKKLISYLVSYCRFRENRHAKDVSITEPVPYNSAPACVSKAAKRLRSSISYFPRKCMAVATAVQVGLRLYSYHICDVSVNLAAIVIRFLACCAETCCEVGDNITTLYFSVNICHRARDLQSPMVL